jgi:hypothetical protein
MPSLRAEYERDVDRGLMARGTVVPSPITDADLAPLPARVARYLHITGAVGQPRVRNVRARMHGRFRGGRNARWMKCSAEQHNFFDQPARLFYMTASMFGIPMQGYHRYVGSTASMRIKAAGLVTIADASGDLMTQGETVTMFNDMCLLAPATLIDPRIQWETIDPHSVRAAFTNAGHTISATLEFDDDGRLTDFWSDDRLQVSPGADPKRFRWSTPVAAYRTEGCPRIWSRGEARWHEPEGEYAYIEIELDDISYNVTSR